MSPGYPNLNPKPISNPGRAAVVLARGPLAKAKSFVTVLNLNKNGSNSKLNIPARTSQNHRSGAAMFSLLLVLNSGKVVPIAFMTDFGTLDRQTKHGKSNVSLLELKVTL